MTMPVNAYNLRPRCREIGNMKSIRDEDNGAPRKNKRKNTSSEGENIRKHPRCSHSTSSMETLCINCPPSSEIEDDLMFTSLPAEVILHVLHYLPLRDRKSIRLTCKSLNEYSKHISFTRKEKFIFTRSVRVSSTSLVREVLSRTTSSHLNLEFRGCDARIDSLSADFLKTCGVRVRSLSFHQCSPDARMLEDIFLFCRNLEVIEVPSYYFECVRKPRYLPEDDFEKALDRLIQLKIERQTHMHTIKFRGTTDISSALFRKIFIVFPNVKHLHANAIKLTTYDCLKPFTQLQSLTYNVREPQPILWLKFQTVPELPVRLTEFRSRIYDPYLCDISRSSLLYFIAAQTQLEVFSLWVYSSLDVEWKKQVMFHVLRSCRKLREFNFFSQPSVFLDSVNEVAEYLNLISKLKCMKLQCLPELPDVLSLSSYMIPTQNLDLSILQTGTTARSGELLRHILKSCPRMQHLLLRGKPRDGVLTGICRSMPVLRTLRVHHPSSDVFDDAEGIRNLESLEVSGIDLFDEQTIKQLQKIQFWRLKHVKLEFLISFIPQSLRRGEIDELCKILWNMPVVETVELPDLIVSYPRELKLFKNSKNLRCLICHRVTSHKARLLFKSCPALKFVSNRWMHATFTYDSLTESIISEPLLTLEEQGVLIRDYELPWVTIS